MNNKELEILKDKYAMETLNEQEYASLEVEKLQNPKLESELKIHTDLVRGVEYAGQLELQDMLDKIHYQQVGNVPKSVKSRKTLYLIAGLFILAGVTGYFLWGSGNQNEVNPQLLYADYYTQYQPSLQDRGAGADEAKAAFNQAYTDDNHIEALTTIKPYLTESSNDIKLTAAISANEIGDLVLADRLLNEIIEMKDYYFMDHAIWYKALIKLKTGDIASVKDILTPIISNPKADHHMEAKELVSKLKG